MSQNHTADQARGNVADAPNLAKTVQRLWLGLGLGKDIGNTLLTKTLLVSPPADKVAAAIEKLGSLFGWYADTKQEVKTKWATRAVHQGFDMAAMDVLVTSLRNDCAAASASNLGDASLPSIIAAMPTQQLPDDDVPPTAVA